MIKSPEIIIEVFFASIVKVWLIAPCITLIKLIYANRSSVTIEKYIHIKYGSTDYSGFTLIVFKSAQFDFPFWAFSNCRFSGNNDHFSRDIVLTGLKCLLVYSWSDWSFLISFYCFKSFTWTIAISDVVFKAYFILPWSAFPVKRLSAQVRSGNIPLINSRMSSLKLWGRCKVQNKYSHF